VVGLKPTHGLVPGAGVVPLAGSQDTVGPMGRCVADVALVLDYLTATPLEAGYAAHAAVARLDGVRIGVARDLYTGNQADADACFENALAALRELGATLVDPADIPTARELAAFEDEFLVLSCELADDLGAYLARRNHDRPDLPRSLADLVGFNERRHDAELALFGQDILEFALTTDGRRHPAYAAAFARQRHRAREHGLDAALEAAGAEVLITLTAGPAHHIDQVNGDPRTPVSSSPAAVAGYPALTLPVGSVRGLPVGATIVGRPRQDATVLGVGAALEGVLGTGRHPTFIPSVDTR
jgi:amidase